MVNKYHIYLNIWISCLFEHNLDN